jgi:hypothetical protein
MRSTGCRRASKSSIKLPSGPRLAPSKCSISIFSRGRFNQLYLACPIHEATDTINADCATCEKMATNAVIRMSPFQVDSGLFLNTRKTARMMNVANVPSVHVQSSQRHSFTTDQIEGLWVLGGVFDGAFEVRVDCVGVLLGIWVGIGATGDAEDGFVLTVGVETGLG